MSRKLIVVFGATGNQGGSVVASLLKNKAYAVRAVTRNPDSDKAKALAARGAQVVAADINDYKSLVKALEGAHAAFAVTDFWAMLGALGPDGAFDGEVKQGKNLANAAAATPTLEHYVWSTLPMTKNTTGGAVTVPHFDSKAYVDEYIISSLPDLAKKTTFFWAGYYATNLGSSTSLTKESGKYLWILPCSPSAATPMVGLTTANVGVFVAGILAKPEITLPSRTLQIWGEVTGGQTVFVQKDLDDFVASFPGGPVFGKEVGLNMQFCDSGLKGWSKGDEKILTREDLGIETAQLVSTKQAFEMMDWSSILNA
ncbi:related to nitrogen metabolic regulation protein nmr [Armillaria ostoyae]|uniref:Related to nitrogen metabolic regulation protein nmr n=1 Tax=Armillaria ostoyae TaxID=47428 RepID=A0A284S4U6_ARMOS|nr:related to nitrogen metabolic regulation protein nmr [Armillaria ostoyae]